MLLCLYLLLQSYLKHLKYSVHHTSCNMQLQFLVVDPFLHPHVTINQSGSLDWHLSGTSIALFEIQPYEIGFILFRFEFKRFEQSLMK